MEQSDGDAFEDLASDEVRPLLRSADQMRQAGLSEGEPDIHPDYNGLRGEGVAWDQEMNPNQDQVGHEDRELGLQQGRGDRVRMMRTEELASVDNEPPYQRMGPAAPDRDEVRNQMRDPRVSEEGPISSLFGSRTRTSSSRVDAGPCGRGDGLEQRSSVQLNGKLNPTDQTGHSGGREAASVLERPGTAEQANPSLEQLAHQLLLQNATLHQELIEARLSSGSCSNVSVDGRSEGRGSRRSGAGMQRKGKGIGSDLGPSVSQSAPPRIFTPP